MLKAIILLFLSLSINLIAFGQSPKTFPLKLDWEFREHNVGDWLKAKVPGSVHTDLLENNIIQNPFFDNNEIKQSWIEQKDWEYKSSFSLNKNQLNYEHLKLVFEGLDTYAQIYINGKFVLSANNMFRSWEIDLKQFLIAGENEIRIVFTSPISKNEEKLNQYPYQLPSGNETVDVKVSPFTRKAIYQFGWDWSPRFVSCGIWKPVYLQAWNNVRIKDAFYETVKIKNDTAFIHLEAVVESKEAKGHYILEHFNGSEQILLQTGENRLHFNLAIANPKLWWPNGMGEAHLYSLPLKIKEGAKTIDQKTVDFGVRTILLVNEKDSIGTSFYFVVNGEKIFVKGANYVPQDIFLNRVSEKDYKLLIKKAKEAHFNMLRVWGGGIYEKDIFYELCDKNGIMVWQDFMFANSLYPLNTSFQINIIQELKENINRLRKHPSIVLWCGNNEIEVAWGNWGWQNQYGYNSLDSTLIWNQQMQLFKSTIPSLLQEYYPTANYTSTTPLSNWGTPENFNHSSMHYWGVWHGKEPFINFSHNVGRFMVEYGFQSFPNYNILKKSVSPDQMELNSDVMKNRQKSYIGNGMITKHSENWFGPSESFEDYVEKSQKTQAIAMQIAITQHRLKQPHCMGTLFWQFNDSWPGPSWSVLNHDYSEKIAYETVKTWYAPIIAMPTKVKDELVLYVVSDKLEKSEVKVKIMIEGKLQEQYISKPILVKKGIMFELRTGLFPKGKFDIKLELEENKKTVWNVTVPSSVLF